MKEISKQNAQKLGNQTLLFQTMEECGELIKAISKYNRTNGIGQKTEKTQEEAFFDMVMEIADVEICLEQLKYLMGINDEVKQAKDVAFDKVAKRYGDNQ